MEDNNNPTPRYIPENYSIGINVGGMHFKTRNFFEGIALAAALGGLAYWVFNKMSFIEYGTRIGLIISFAIMGLVLGIIGINDEPISVFFLNWIRFLKDKRTAFYNPHTKTRDKNKVRPYLFTYKEEKESLSTENITSFFKKFKASIEKSQIEKMVEFQKANTFNETTMFFQDDDGSYEKPFEYMNRSERKKYFRRLKREEKQRWKEERKQLRQAEKEAKKLRREANKQ